jgi:two-component system nitrate/nitrite response regulator NarL
MQLVFAHDHRLFQDAIVAYLERAMLPLEIVCYSDLAGVERHLEKRVPDLLLLDWKMPGMHGDETVAHLKSMWPQLNLAVFTGMANDPQQGAKRVPHFSKHMTGHSMLENICGMLGLQTANDRAILTRREKDVLQQLKRGSSNKQIAQALDIKEITVKLHVRHICRKFGFSNRTQLALSAPLLAD